MVLAPFGTAVAADPIVVRVGSVPNETAADMFYAKDQGFFKDAGLDVQVEVLANGQNLVGAVSSGTYDIATSTTVAIAIAREAGIAVKVIAPNSVHLSSAPTDLLMVAKNAPFHSAHDLNGKTVAVSGLGNMPFVATRAWLTKNGGDVPSMHFVEFPVPAMADALQLGRVDLALISEPFIATAKSVARPLSTRPPSNPYDVIGQRFINAGWFATDSWLQQHPDVARKFVAAVRKAHEWANAHADESAVILVRHTKLTPEMVKDMTRAVFGTTLEPQLLQPVLDVAAASGMLRRPIAAADIIWEPEP